ncbi:unnamed protein product, partial [Musa acuminata subsp. burmannicoides]
HGHRRRAFSFDTFFHNRHSHPLYFLLLLFCTNIYTSSSRVGMAQRGHVPRFGDWNQNAAYTTYFETARKGKATGSNIVNPNDPEQSPELHKPGALAAEPSYPYPKQGPVNQQPKPNNGREERQLEGGYAPAPPQSRNSSQGTTVDRYGRNHAAARRNPGEVGYIPSPSPVSPSRAGNARGGLAGRQRATAVPKFGEWDATDPKSSPGYTVIFNQVKEDKKASTAAHLPKVPVQPTRSPATAEKAYRNDDSCWTARLGLEGAAVVVSSRKQVRSKLRSKGIEVMGVVCHVSNPQHRHVLIEKTVQV